MKFVKESLLEATVEEVFAFHERPDAFELLQPPWERMVVIQPPASLEVGTVVIAETRIGPLAVRIEAEHVAYEKNRRFADEMRRGPFAAWHHEHLFIDRGGRCLLRDEIDFEPPLGVLGRLAAPVAILPRLRRMFDYRHRVTRDHVARDHATRQ